MWEGVGDWTKTATYWPPQPLRTSLCVVLVLLGCSTGGLGAQLSAECWLSLPHLITNGSPNSIGGPEGPFCQVVAFSTTSCLRLLWYPTLKTNWLPVSPSYMIVQSPTQYHPMTGHRDVSHPLSLEWHVWSSSNGNNCHAVHSSLSSSASVYGIFILSHFFSQAPLRDFFS